MKFSELVYLVENQQHFGFYDDSDVKKDSPELQNIKELLRGFISYLSDDIDYLNDIETSAKYFIEDLYDGFSEDVQYHYIQRLIDLTWKYIDNNQQEFEYKENTAIITFGTDTYFLEQDDEFYEFTAISEEEISQNPEGFLEEHFPKFNVRNIYLGAIGGSYGELQDDPSGTYYHYTTEEAWEEIKEDGYMETSRGSGLYNRDQSGIFTTIEPTEYDDGTYGDICLELDITAYIKDGHNATADIEGPILESEIEQFICYCIDKECLNSCDSDYSQYTVLIVPEDGTLPLKYIKRVDK